MTARYRSSYDKGNPDVPVNGHLAAFRHDWETNRWEVAEDPFRTTPNEIGQEQVSFWITPVRGNNGAERAEEYAFSQAVLDHFHDGLLMEYVELEGEPLQAKTSPAEHVRNGVCLICGDGVLNDGSHIDPERHEKALWKAGVFETEGVMPEYLAEQIRKGSLGGYSIEGKDI